MELFRVTACQEDDERTFFLYLYQWVSVCLSSTLCAYGVDAGSAISEPWTALLRKHAAMRYKSSEYCLLKKESECRRKARRERIPPP